MNGRDRVFEAFLEKQRSEGLRLADDSDIVRVVCCDPQHFLVSYQARGLVRTAEGVAEEAHRFAVGIYFGPDYLRRIDPFSVVTWFWPLNVFHPNIRPPFVCVGRIAPGTPLVDLIFQVYECLTWQKATIREDDALNHEACAWGRRNRNLWPVETRPLRRRTPALRVEPVERRVVGEGRP